jgi:hypothetical protein
MPDRAIKEPLKADDKETAIACAGLLFFSEEIEGQDGQV